MKRCIVCGSRAMFENLCAGCGTENPARVEIWPPRTEAPRERREWEGSLFFNRTANLYRAVGQSHKLGLTSS